MDEESSIYTDREKIEIEEDGSLKAPKFLYASPTAARAIYRKLQRDGVERAMTNAMVDGLIAGNPPYDDQELAQEGLSHISNFNDLSALSTYERSMLAYSNATYQTETLVKFVLHIPEEDQAPKFADIMSYELDYVLMNWNAFIPHIHTNISQIVKYGLSFLVWGDEKNWMFDVIETDNFLAPGDTSSDPDDITFFHVRNTYTLQYLYQMYATAADLPEGEMIEDGWSKQELDRLLLHYANKIERRQSTDTTEFLTFQEVYANADSNAHILDHFLSESITLISFFQKEYDGQWTHYMFDPDIDEGDFVFKQPDIGEQLSDFLVPFVATPGEKKMFNSKGVGHKIYSSSLAQLQINNSIVDMTKLSSTPLLKGTATQDNEHLRITPGVLNFIGMTDMVQTQFGANINQLVGAAQYLSQKMEYNISNAGDNPVEPDKSVGSLAPAEGQRLSHREHALTKNHMSQYYHAMDMVIRNIVKRMLSSKEGDPGYIYCKEWKDRCTLRGVPPNLFDDLTKMIKKEGTRNRITGLPKILDVRASRVAGDGSTYARVMAMQQYSQLMGADLGGPRQVQDFRRQAIMATLGPEYLETYDREESEVDERAGGASLAGVENAVMMMGKSPVFSPDNEHRSHMATHMALSRDIIKRIRENQMDVVEADRIFSVLLPHLQETLEYASKSPYNQKWVQGMTQSMKEVTNYAQLTRKNAQRAIQSELKKREQDAAKTQEVMEDAERKDFQVKRDEARKDYALQSKEQRTAAAEETRGQTKKRAVELDAQNERHRINLEAENQKKKTTDEMSIAELKAEGDRMQGESPSPTNVENP